MHLTEIADPSTDDLWILETARETGRIIVTLDADFHALLAALSVRAHLVGIRRLPLTTS